MSSVMGAPDRSFDRRHRCLSGQTFADGGGPLNFVVRPCREILFQKMRIQIGDLQHHAVQALLNEHPQNMYELSPPESVHALNHDELRSPDITGYHLLNSLEERAKRAMIKRSDQLLAKVPDVEPEESDRL